jgi:hypothetical protein
MKDFSIQKFCPFLWNLIWSIKRSELKNKESKINSVRIGMDLLNDGLITIMEVIDIRVKKMWHKNIFLCHTNYDFPVTNKWSYLLGL